MEAAPGSSREAPVSAAGPPKRPSGLPMRDVAVPSPLRAWAPWIAGAAGLLLIAVVVVLVTDVASAGRRVAALEARAAALAAEVEALRATQEAAASRTAEVRAQFEELQRRVDGLSVRAPAPAAPPQPVPRAPPPPAPPRAAPGRQTGLIPLSPALRVVGGAADKQTRPAVFAPPRNEPLGEPAGAWFDLFQTSSSDPPGSGSKSEAVSGRGSTEPSALRPFRSSAGHGEMPESGRSVRSPDRRKRAETRPSACFGRRRGKSGEARRPPTRAARHRPALTRVLWYRQDWSGQQKAFRNMPSRKRTSPPWSASTCPCRWPTTSTSPALVGLAIFATGVGFASPARGAGTARTGFTWLGAAARCV
jgi:hypothetical protein